MTTRRDRRLLASAASLLVALTLGGVAMAATLPATPASTHASSTAVSHAAGADAGGIAAQAAHPPAALPTTDANQQAAPATPDTATPDQGAHGALVAAAAQSALAGGAHQNHGGYVSCVARGGSDCTSTTPTLPSRGKRGSHGPSTGD